MSAFGRLARLPKYIRAIRKLIEKLYLGALQGAQKELVKFPNSAFMALATAAVLVAEVADGTSAALWPQNTRRHLHLALQQNILVQTIKKQKSPERAAEFRLLGFLL